MDERGRSIMCDRTLPASLFPIYVQIFENHIINAIVLPSFLKFEEGQAKIFLHWCYFYDLLGKKKFQCTVIFISVSDTIVILCCLVEKAQLALIFIVRSAFGWT